MSRRARLLLVVHAAATWFMAGVVWFVQLVHYPLLARLGPGALAAYERGNIGRTACVVGPVMLLEALCAVLLLWRRPASLRAAHAAAGAALLALIWASTALVQLPLHEALSRGADPALVARLVASNWARTALWSLRALLAARWLARGLALPIETAA